MADQPDGKSGNARRKLERTAVLWSGSLLCDGDVIECIIVNMAPTGAMVRVENPDRCKTLVLLRCARFGELAGEITWRQGKDLGIAFRDGADTVSKMLEKALH